MWKVLQSDAEFITKCYSCKYIAVWDKKLLQSVTVVTKWDVIPVTSNLLNLVASIEFVIKDNFSF